MPSAAGPASAGMTVVSGAKRVFTHALASVEEAKSTPTIDPALTSSDFGDTISRLDVLFKEDEGDRYSAFSDGAERKKLRRYAVVETAVRDIFAELIADIPIDSPKFISVWNLLDLLAILSDKERCEPALLFWLIEELLDTQTISGCRQVFDYLESRRERITAKNFKQKHLVILRTCNELLRRLSRAEDTSFCGRVFIFMFQSFPLGDKSSVNLRGEYHVENVTVYDTSTGKEEATSGPGVPAKAGETTADVMEVDENPADPNIADFEALYPVFWSLQNTFSQPKKLFAPENLAKFKSALELTLSAFQTVRGNSRGEETRRTGGAQDVGQTHAPSNGGQLATTATLGASNFNPKYLTNRDLFELEIRDLSFRRHVLVQALIIMDFIISLTAKSKEKLAGIAVNKSVAYLDHTVTEQDATWAADMKRQIADFLRPDPEGPFYLRMVETVLSRDKNWVRWKIENCPSIERPAITTELFLEAVDNVTRLATTKKSKPFIMGSLSLDFLDDLPESDDHDDNDVQVESDTESAERLHIASLNNFRGKLGDLDFDIDMEQDMSKKALLEDRKAAISWQALRLTSLHNIAAFDTIENADKIDTIYQEKTDPDAIPEPTVHDSASSNTKLPEDVRLIVITGPPGTGKETLVTSLVDKYSAVFKRVTRHTTRGKQDSDVLGHFAYVDKKAFSVMVDGDQFLEFHEQPDTGVEYGTTRRMVTNIIDAGKVPVTIVPYDSVQMIKDMGFSARHVLVTAPDAAAVKTRAMAAQATDDAAEAVARAYEEAVAKPEFEAGFDVVLVNDELDKTLVKLLKFIHEEDSDDGNTDGQDPSSIDQDVNMETDHADSATQTSTLAAQGAVADSAIDKDKQGVSGLETNVANKNGADKVPDSSGEKKPISSSAVESSAEPTDTEMADT
ncbi:hypothetical protein BROUX41_003866 [Berkeleyomyces rouxiae]|uniref:uncharacterized protein n=1 Tax=Berkeleyomyces rouxiae TaxID=2035830 RepID=UPI003B7CEE13